MTVKIINITHKKCFLPISPNIITVHAGREIAKEKSKDGILSSDDLEWLKINTLGDNSGENISSLNRYYNEMTGIYWVWKNYEKIGNPDFVGFMHYRRHFILNERISISGNYVKDLGLTPENLNFYCQKYDLIHPPFIKMKHGKFIDGIGPEFCVLGGEKIKQAILIVLDIIKEQNQNHFDQVQNVFNSYETGSFCNMFIMKKELFFEYCKWIFPILFELDKRLNKNYEPGQERCIGWVAEMLTSVFIYLKSKEVSHKEVCVYNQDPLMDKKKKDVVFAKIKMLFCKKGKKLKYKNIILNDKLRKKYKNQEV